MHRERVERHCKGVTTSLNEFKARFQQMVEEHDKEVRLTAANQARHKHGRLTIYQRQWL